MAVSPSPAKRLASICGGMKYRMHRTAIILKLAPDGLMQETIGF
jgi:hypothetical protein